jgi:hypothetical protein
MPYHGVQQPSPGARLRPTLVVAAPAASTAAGACMPWLCMRNASCMVALFAAHKARMVPHAAHP